MNRDPIDGLYQCRWYEVMHKLDLAPPDHGVKLMCYKFRDYEPNDAVNTVIRMFDKALNTTDE